MSASSQPHKRSRWRLEGRALVGVPMVLLFLFLALVGPWLAPYAPRAIDLAHELEGPSLRHWLGTADNGVDVLSVLLTGARTAGLVGVSTVLISFVLGSALGSISGYAGGRTDLILARVTDAVAAMPSLVINVALLALIARPGFGHMIAALSATGWVTYARVSRAEVLRLREREFVTAARALGASPSRVLLLHVLPNAMGPLIVQATFGLGGAVLAEASLSFLGLGPGAGASWGALLDQGTAYLLRAPRLAMIAGVAIAMTVLGFNLTGDWLRDALDPKESSD
ncbi:MAG: ABC transporter permease [Deltaproteobacteria bacterium]|nr:ABC transporter permease [Deltaproteobacteria bacterium]